MKRFFTLALVGVLTTLLVPACAQTNPMDQVSYSFGLLIAKQLKSQGVESIDAESFVKGLKDVFDEKDLEIDPQEANQVVQNFLTEIANKKSEAALVEERTFLEANKQKEGVMVTESGLQYEILTPGDGGAKPTPSNQVTVHYEGKLLDGTVFDASYGGDPATFGLTQVISGWTEGLQLMDVGSKFRFYIPHDLAYGTQGRPPRIPAYSTLIFDVELIEIK